MFKKPVKIKSNNQVKGSDRKGIKDSFHSAFPNLPEEELNALFNNKKDQLNCIKLVTHTNEVVQVYTLQKQPLFFVLRSKLYPTVFLLWKYPNLLPSFTTHPQVVGFIASGADLMLPGVVSPPGGLPHLQEGSVVCVNTTDNRAAVAVGETTASTFDLQRNGGRGRCVSVCHFNGDYLCSLDGFHTSLVRLGPPEWLSITESDFPPLGGEKCEVKSETPEPQVGDIQMDELLTYCFLASIKYSKSLTLPLLLSNFFKLQMLPMCPEGCSLDLKKTSYKKLKPFLEEMALTGLITVKEIKKGVEAITEINKNHPKYSEFYLKPNQRPQAAPLSNPTKVTESFIITSQVAPIFLPEYKKGDMVDGGTIRKLVTQYVKTSNCHLEDNPRLINPKTEPLKTICKTEHPVSWEELFEKVCDSMKSCFKVSSGNELVVNRGKVAPITMTVSVRSGNKKVTLVDNLESFGVNIQEFAKDCQHGVAASTSVTPTPPGKKCDQLLVQGNQVVFVHNLLVDKYKIPKKYIRGLELAPKKKK